MESEIKLYTIDDICDIFKVGRTSAYRIMHERGMNSFKLGTKLYVSHDNLVKFIKRSDKIFLTKS